MWWLTLDEFLDWAQRVLSRELARREDLATVGTSGKLIASLTEGQPVVWSMGSEATPRSPRSSRQPSGSGRSSSKTNGFNMGGSRTLWAH